MEGEKTIEVRDARKRQMFKIDDRYLNGYARICGAYASLVYISLCRHADNRQECYPSIEKLCWQHGISKPTVLKALRKLEEFCIIQIAKRRDKKTNRQMVNIYTLMDVSVWKPIPSADPGAYGAIGSVKNTPIYSDSDGEPGARGALGSESDPSKSPLPGAGSISDVDPGQSHDIKPGKRDLPEGYTGEQGYTEKGVAQSATDSVSTQNTCAYGNGNECRKVPIRGRSLCKIHQPMNGDEFVEWYRKSEKRYIRLIAEFADEVKPTTCETVAQWETWAACHYKAAIKIEPFSDDQIAVGIERVKAAKYLTSWNLETLLKYIVNVEVEHRV